MHQEVAYVLSTGTKTEDVGWSWTAMSLNFLQILFDLADMRGNNG